MGRRAYEETSKVLNEAVVGVVNFLERRSK
jgi:hypothetical protein